MNKKICEFVSVRLKLKVGKSKFDLMFGCFDGWNKIGIMSHIGKMFGLKNGYIEFSLKSNLNVYRSINYYKKITELSGKYVFDSRFNLKDRYELIYCRGRMGLRQFLIRNMETYNFSTFYEFLNMKQLVELIKFIYKADYLTNGCEILLANEKTSVSSLKDNSEIICHYRIKGENPKHIGTSSSDESEEEYDGLPYQEEEEEEVREV
jgi:hypothetical protein